MGKRILETLAFYNEALKATDETKRSEVAERYQAAVPPENRADACIKCGECEEKCPQKLPIRRLLSSSKWILRRSS